MSSITSSSMLFRTRLGVRFQLVGAFSMLLALAVTILGVVRQNIAVYRLYEHNAALSNAGGFMKHIKAHQTFRRPSILWVTADRTLL